MKITGPTIFIVILSLCLLPGVAAARQSFSKMAYFDNLYRSTIGTSAAAPVPEPQSIRVPDPKATRVQVHIFKKSTVLWPQAIPGLPPLPPGAAAVSGKILVKDPQVAGLIQKYAKQHGVDPKLVQAMIRAESGFNPFAVSPKGAMGLMQLMPETAASLGVEDPFDIEQNIKGGVRFLRICLKKFDQNLPLALAAYNAGPGRVVEHQGVPPFKETHSYVKKIVLDYCGQTVDPEKIKLGPAAETQVAQNQPDKAVPVPVTPPAQGPLNLTFFTAPGPGRLEALTTPPERSDLKKTGQLSIY